MLHKALARNYERLDAILAADKSAKRRSKR